MSEICVERETLRRSPLALLMRAVRLEVARAELVAELEGLSEPLLADLGIGRADIRAFARATVRGERMKPPHLRRGEYEPVTQIGSEVWSRAVLLRVGLGVGASAQRPVLVATPTHRLRGPPSPQGGGSDD